MNNAAEKKFPAHIVTVDGVITNDRGEVLLVKHRHKEYWFVPGGQVEIGESLPAALEREIMEETGITVKVDRLICVTTNSATHEGYNGYGTVPTKVMNGFACTYVSGELTTSDETSEVTWVPLERWREYITLPYLVIRFEAFFEKNGVRYIDYVLRPEYKLKTMRTI